MHREAKDLPITVDPEPGILERQQDAFIKVVVVRSVRPYFDQAANQVLKWNLGPRFVGRYGPEFDGPDLMNLSHPRPPKS